MSKDNKTVTYSVPGINCDHCEVKVKAAVEAIDGVKTATASADAKNVVIEYTSSDAPDFVAVNEALSPIGYPLARSSNSSAGA